MPIRFVNPPEAAPPPGYAHVAQIRGGHIVYVAGQVALNQRGELVGGGDLETQADQAFRNLAAALAAVGCAPEHVAKLTVFLRDMDGIAAYRRARDRFLGASIPAATPAITLVEVSRLFRPDLLIEVEAVAVTPEPIEPSPPTLA